MRHIRWAVFFGVWAALNVGGRAAASPSPLWTTRVVRAETPTQSPRAIAVANDGTVAVAGGVNPGRLFLLDGRTGNVRWRHGGPRERGFLSSFGTTWISADGRRVLAERARGLPESEWMPAGVTALNGAGRVLWRTSFGNGVLSPRGAFAAPKSFDASATPRLAMLESLTGRALWSVAPEPLGRVADAVFSPDDACLLVHTVRRRPAPAAGTRAFLQPWNSLWTAKGEPLWIFEFPGGVYPAWTTGIATSDNGRISAILDPGDGARPSTLTILSRAGVAQGQWNIGADAGQKWWQHVAVSRDGRAVFLYGRDHSTSRQFILACNVSGRIAWEATAQDRADGSRTVFVLLPDGAVRSGFQGGGEALLLDGAGNVALKASAPNAVLWAISPNGRYLAAASRGGTISLFGVPPGLAKAVPETTGEGKESLSPSGAAVWTWRPARDVFPAGQGWSLRFDGKKRETVARRAGRLVRLRHGSRWVEIDARNVSLPGPVLLLRGRTMVPDTLQNLPRKADQA